MGTGSCGGTCKSKHDTWSMTGHPPAAPHKTCRQCRVRIKWDGLYCPCCGNKLSTRIRGGKSRKKRLEEVARY